MCRKMKKKRLDDTDKFLKAIVDAMNWEIAVVNGISELLNAGKECVNKKVFNEKISKFAEALKINDDGEIAEAIQILILEFENLNIAAKEVITQ